MDILDLAENGKIKRVFLARNKANFAGAISHITQHSCGSEPLFVEEGDYLYFLHLIKDRSKKFEMDIFAFCLMPNHIHFLLRINKPNLPLAMQGIFSPYAKYFNHKYERKGHVFCGPFRQALCLDDTYLLAASVYIHLNPQKAGLSKDYRLYRWSSVNLYTGNVDKETFINFRYVLRLLGDDLPKARQSYGGLLDKLTDMDIKPTREARGVLEEIRGRIFKLGNFLDKATLPKEQGVLSDREIELKIEELKRKQRLKLPQEQKARKFIIGQLKARGYNVNEIANKLSLSRQTISHLLNVNV